MFGGSLIGPPKHHLACEVCHRPTCEGTHMLREIEAVRSRDFLDEMIAQRTARNPDFPRRMAEARRKREAILLEAAVARLFACK